MQPTDDNRLVGEAQAGDRRAFEELVRRHDKGVLRLALRLVGREDEARDIYQEAFLRLYRTLPRFRGECSLETWLLRIVTSVAVDHLRRRAARPEDVAPWARDGGPAPGEPADERPDRDPERAAARGEIRRRIEAALGGLAPRERLVFEMRHYEGMRLRAIGDAIGTTEETVKNCLYRAHRHLRSALRDLGGVGFGPLPSRGDGAPAEA